MKSAPIELYFKMNVTCPYCEHTFDLMTVDYEGEWSGPIFSNKWHELEDAEIECEHCRQEFYVSEVEY